MILAVKEGNWGVGVGVLRKRSILMTILGMGCGRDSDVDELVKNVETGCWEENVVFP